MDGEFIGVIFSRLGYSPDTLSQINQAALGDKPDPRTIQQLVTAYKQTSPEREEIRAFERKHQITLPLDYIQFLMQINGGYPDKTFVTGFDDLIVNVFYAFNCPYPEDSVVFRFEKTPSLEELPRHQLLPIAGLNNGNELMMGIADRKANEIFEISFNADLNIFENRYIAGTFSELVSLLIEEPYY